MCGKGSWHKNRRKKKEKYLAAVGFEPTPYKWLVPKTSALDHSATLPSGSAVDQIYNLNSTQLSVYSPRQWIIWASLQRKKKHAGWNQQSWLKIVCVCQLTILRNWTSVGGDLKELSVGWDLKEQNVVFSQVQCYTKWGSKWILQICKESYHLLLAPLWDLCPLSWAREEKTTTLFNYMHW